MTRTPFGPDGFSFGVRVDGPNRATRTLFYNKTCIAQDDGEGWWLTTDLLNEEAHQAVERLCEAFDKSMADRMSRIKNQISYGIVEAIQKWEAK